MEIKKKKIPQHTSLWILVVGTLASLTLHQYYDYQAHREIFAQQQEILETYQKLEQSLAEHSRIAEERTGYLQQINDYLLEYLQSWVSEVE